MTMISPSHDWICLQSSAGASAGKADAPAVATLDNRGLAYGDGFFTTMGVIAGQILWADYHQQRLLSHADALHLDLDSQSLLTTLQAQAVQLQHGMLKLIVTRSAQDIRGYGYTPSASGSACEVWLKSSAMTIATTEQLRLPNANSVPMQPVQSASCLMSQLACLPPALAGLKSLNRLDNVLASAELQRRKAQLSSSNAESSIADLGEGLLRDMTGNWVEGTMSNVFYQLAEPSPSMQPSSNPKTLPKSLPDHNKNDPNYLTTGQWYTPSLAKSGVTGVMRQVIIEGLANSKHPVIIRSLQDKDLPQLSQLFFCNALRGIMPMSSLTLLSGKVVSF